MSKLDHARDRATELLAEIGAGLRRKVPDRAAQWIETGAALGAARAGGKVAAGFVRRNPVLAVAAVAGAGLLWYAAKQRAKAAQDAPIEGEATRVETPRSPRRRKRAADVDADSGQA